MPTKGAVLQWRGLTIRRELDGTHRNDEQLVVAFVAVAELKKVNDSEPHAAGGELRRQAAPIDQAAAALVRCDRPVRRRGVRVLAGRQGCLA